MNRLSIQFPPVCAWCGQRPPQSNREVKLRSSGSSRHKVRLDFSAPICAECESYAQTGYASDTGDPCGLYTAPARVRFYNETYHERFTALNPERAWQPKS